MRFLIVILAIVLVPVLAGLHLWWYDLKLKPDLADRARRVLTKAGIKHAEVTLDWLDATIMGTAADVETRESATQAVQALAGIHLLPERNQIVVPARIEARLEEKHLYLSGWLPDERAVQSLLKIIGEFRPDLELDAKKLRVSPFVVLAGAADAPLSEQHRLVKPVLDSLKVPASFSIEKSGETYVVKGFLPTPELRQAVLDSIQGNPGGWQIDASELNASRFVDEAVFTQSNALPVFLASYFQAPVPGTFSIDAGSGPRLSADATREMEAEWLGLLRGVSGAAKVEADLRIHPSIYQLPGYRPESVTVEGTLEPLVQTLRQTAFFFDATTGMLPPDEESKLSSLVPLITACGPGLRIILSGSNLEPDAQLPGSNRERAETVRAKLIE